MTRIVALERVRYLASVDRTTWRVQLACGAHYTVNQVGNSRPVIGTAVYCGCATCTRQLLATMQAPTLGRRPS